MAVGPTIGVLATSFGGTHAGGVLGGIQRMLASVGGRMIAIQTLEAGTFDIDPPEPPQCRHQVAWERVSGFVVILKGADREHLTRAQNSGRPVVTVSDDLAGLPCPAVLPDNRSGVRQAIEHLLEHGHRRIAFAGYTAQKDISERFEVYRDTLLSNGIQSDPVLFFDTGNNRESGGRKAARNMLAAGMPSTAVMAGNDRNAVGLMRALEAAGCSVPRDQAVIGFDDSENDAFLVPSLSTIHQPLGEVGYEAARLLLEQINGRHVRNGAHHIPTELIRRESCGCSRALSVVTAPISAGPDPLSVQDLTERLRSFLTGKINCEEQRRSLALLPNAITALAETLGAALEGRPCTDIVRLREDLTPLTTLITDPDSFVESLRIIRRYGRSLLQEGTGQAPADGTITRLQQVDDCLQEIAVVISQAQTRSEFERSAGYLSALDNHYAVSAALLRAREYDPRSLHWLRCTPAKGACLGLWPPLDPRTERPRSLEIVGTLDRSAGAMASAPYSLPIREFPPLPVLEQAEASKGDMVLVTPLKLRSGDWGYLSIVGPVEATLRTGREVMNQWAALLSVALEHDALLRTSHEQEERLRRAVQHDATTGLPTRSFFRDRLESAIHRASRRKEFHYAVLLLDLDEFSRINDTLGHLAGDRLLTQVGERIAGQLRGIDTASRFGGDEFAVLLEEIQDEASAATFTRRLHTVINAPYDVNGHEVSVNASVGIVVGTAEHSSADQVIRDAETAMRWAKSNHKGSHVLFEEAMLGAAVDRMRTESGLRRAINSGELEVHFQPIVNLSTGAADAAEALLRWEDPQSGLRLPMDFLAAAEESGLILPIDSWVMDEAFRTLRTWNARRPEGRPVQVSVNVSGRYFRDALFLESLRRRFKQFP
ncbi:MAG: hypothetical protein QG608_3626, partial [Actinomycetota bacterium]|nr:hypothetical protein [Actinomycetota bacterium]